MTIAILIAVYLVSAYGVYKWVQLAFYHERSIYKDSKPDYHELFATITPFFNTVFLILFWAFIYPIESDKKPKNRIENFFKSRENI